MKKVTVCLGCGKPVAQRLCYKAKVEKLVRNFMSGEEKIQTMEGYLCPLCNQKVGYSTSKEKLERYSKYYKNKWKK